MMAVAATITAVSVYLGNGALSLNIADGTAKRIIVYITKYDQERSGFMPYFSYANVQEIQSNDGMRFLNPYAGTMSKFDKLTGNGNIDPYSLLTPDERMSMLKDADSYEQYILVKLPKESGGYASDIGAFRAYSSLDPESKCILSYRYIEHVGAVLQDPCHSDMFRAFDGYSCYGRIAVGPNPVVSSYNAIPRMRLTMDSEGYVTAIRQDNQLHGDGVIGEGRILSNDEITAGSKADSTCQNLIHN